MEKKLLTRQEAAQYLSISLSTLERIMKTGSLKGVRVGGAWRVAVTELEAFIAKGGTQ